MSESKRWQLIFDRSDWLVVEEGTPYSSPFIGPVIADCGKSESHANSIVSDHNACIGIEEPETTVPELVAACKACARYFAACGLAWQANDGVLVREDGRPVVAADGLDGLCDAACDAVHAVLTKTGKQHDPPEPERT